MGKGLVTTEKLQASLVWGLTLQFKSVVIFWCQLFHFYSNRHLLLTQRSDLVA